MENMKFKGTKGKWDEARYAKGHIKSAETGRMIAGCMGYTTNTDNGEHIQESLANAQLISKAPEMLEMLEKVLDHLTPEFPESSQELLLDEIKQLIKEATTI